MQWTTGDNVGGIGGFGGSGATAAIQLYYNVDPFFRERYYNETEVNALDNTMHCFNVARNTKSPIWRQHDE